MFDHCACLYDRQAQCTLACTTGKRNDAAHLQNHHLDHFPALAVLFWKKND